MVMEVLMKNLSPNIFGVYKESNSLGGCQEKSRCCRLGNDSVLWPF